MQINFAAANVHITCTLFIIYRFGASGSSSRNGPLQMRGTYSAARVPNCVQPKFKWVKCNEYVCTKLESTPWSRDSRCTFNMQVRCTRCVHIYIIYTYNIYILYSQRTLYLLFYKIIFYTYTHTCRSTQCFTCG